MFTILELPKRAVWTFQRQSPYTSTILQAISIRLLYEWPKGETEGERKSAKPTVSQNSKLGNHRLGKAAPLTRRGE